VEWTLYFDRNIGWRVPEAMRLLGLKNVVHHNTDRTHIGLKPIKGQKGLFADDETDDSWLKFVGEKGWIVLTQDSKFHKTGFENELSAIKQFSVGCFYIWGAEADKWQKMIALCKAYENIAEASQTTAKPFIYSCAKGGSLTQIPIP
jgi:hypothetical protein